MKSDLVKKNVSYICIWTRKILTKIDYLNYTYLLAELVFVIFENLYSVTG